jgi:peptide/nickel transport system permease protein
MIVTIGLTVGVTAGYLGGTVDTVLMRFTDIVYTIPLLIFGIVLLAYVDPSLFTTILVIGSILWRSSARVLRSQVLQIK